MNRLPHPEEKTTVAITFSEPLELQQLSDLYVFLYYHACVQRVVDHVVNAHTLSDSLFFWYFPNVSDEPTNA